MGRGACPGSDGRDITSEDVPCSECGSTVEVFSDELRRKCPECGNPVSSTAAPSCSEWCPSAAACLGGSRNAVTPESDSLPKKSNSKS
jgi:endogenous inhibitor of DNA gyrase (YacG/DUF329 family)